MKVKSPMLLKSQDPLPVERSVSRKKVKKPDACFPLFLFHKRILSSGLCFTSVCFLFKHTQGFLIFHSAKVLIQYFPKDWTVRRCS